MGCRADSEWAEKKCGKRVIPVKPISFPSRRKQQTMSGPCNELQKPVSLYNISPAPGPLTNTDKRKNRRRNKQYSKIASSMK